MGIDLSKLCSGCYGLIKEGEEVFAFQIIDDYGEEITFKGHRNCMLELNKKLMDTFEVDNDE